MFEETIKIEIDKYEQRVLEINQNLVNMANELAKEKNLSYAHIEKKIKYDEELSTLRAYLEILNFAVLNHKEKNFLDQMIDTKTASLKLSNEYKKKMSAIYTKYPETDNTDPDTLSKGESDKIINDIETLEIYLTNLNIAMARYRIALFVLRTLDPLTIK